MKKLFLIIFLLFIFINCEKKDEEENQIDVASGSRVLGWPINCIPETDCTIGHADVNGDGKAYDCSDPGYTGHEGTDILVNYGTDVYACC